MSPPRSNWIATERSHCSPNQAERLSGIGGAFVHKALRTCEMHRNEFGALFLAARARLDLRESVLLPISKGGACARGRLFVLLNR